MDFSFYFFFILSVFEQLIICLIVYDNYVFSVFCFAFLFFSIYFILFLIRKMFFMVDIKSLGYFIDKFLLVFVFFMGEKMKFQYVYGFDEKLMSGFVLMV